MSTAQNNVRFPFLDLRAVNAPFINEIKEATSRVIESGRYIGGDEVKELEDRICHLTHAEAAVGVANGLDALRLALRAAVIAGYLKNGDKVVVPANTYIASVLAITDASLIPVLVDPDEDTMVLNSKCLERPEYRDIKAIMPVHLYGRIAWDEQMREIVKDKKLFVIEDVAQSIGALATTDGLFESRHAGAIGHIAAFSFYPTKNIGALGDAGAVTTNLPELAEIVRALANYGSDRRYHNIYQGFNSRLDPLQAAILSVKLNHLEETTADRFANVVAYHNTIDNHLVKKPVFTASVTDCVWHQYVIRCKERELMRKYLLANGVETDIHYAVPPHRQPCYKGLEHGPLPVTERLSEEVISLPVAPGCTSVKDASDIGRIINEFR